MRFFRGITVPASVAATTIRTITESGLLEGQGTWQMEHLHPGPPDALLNKIDLSTEDTRPRGAKRDPAVCACGEQDGASYYAWRHNRSGQNDTPILIEFAADEISVAVDGKDFLYTVFQFGDPERARSILEHGFGEAVLRYADRAWTMKEHSSRIALCDLAIHDLDVVKAHHANDLVFAGRHMTTFRNAFTVKLPVKSDALVRVWSPNAPPRLPPPDVSLRDLLISQQ